MKKEGPRAAWRVLAGVVLLRGLCNGGINMTSGLFLEPVARELETGVGNLSIYFSISSLTMALVLPRLGRVVGAHDARWMAVLGAGLQALSFAAMGMQTSLWGWYILSIPQAVGAAITVNLLGPVLLGRWFSGSLGLPVGIMLCGGSLLGVVLQPMTSWLIAGWGWRRAYLIMGLTVFFGASAASLALLRNRPEAEVRTVRDRETGPGGRSVPAARAVRSGAFWMLLLFLVFMTGVGVFSQYVAAYGASLGYGLERTGAALALYSLGSALGAVILGWFSDRVGSVRTCFGVIAMGAAAVLGFLWGRPWPVFALAAFAYGLMNVGATALAPALTVSFFGPADYEALYARASMGAPLAAIFLMPAYGFLYDRTGSYQLVLLGLLGLLALAGISVGLGWRKRPVI